MTTNEKFRVQVFKMVDEGDLIIEMDICSVSKTTECLTKVAKSHGLEGFKKIFFKEHGSRFVTDGGKVDEYFDIEHPDRNLEEIEIVVCKTGDIQVHKVPAEVDDVTGFVSFDVYKDMVKTDKYYVKSITL